MRVRVRVRVRVQVRVRVRVSEGEARLMVVVTSVPLIEGGPQPATHLSVAGEVWELMSGRGGAYERERRGS